MKPNATGIIATICTLVVLTSVAIPTIAYFALSGSKFGDQIPDEAQVQMQHDNKKTKSKSDSTLPMANQETSLPAADFAASAPVASSSAPVAAPSFASSSNTVSKQDAIQKYNSLNIVDSSGRKVEHELTECCDVSRSKSCLEVKFSSSPIPSNKTLEKIRELINVTDVFKNFDLSYLSDGAGVAFCKTHFYIYFRRGDEDKVAKFATSIYRLKERMCDTDHSVSSASLAKDSSESSAPKATT